MFKIRSKRAFTLAEVLVTLAVIGVIASLTIPPLVKSYEKREWISGYKSTYSIVNRATRMIMADNNGTLLGVWDATAGDHIGMYQAYIPFLKTIKKCENQDPGGNCFASQYYDLMGGGSTVNALYSVILSNGSSLAFFSWPGGSGIYIDMNGGKGPNTYGKDFHSIHIYANSDPIKPYGYDQDESSITTNCSSNLGATGVGIHCGVRILRGDYAEDY